MELGFATSQMESWPIDRLRHCAQNTRMHGSDQVIRIAASMARIGGTEPYMVADDSDLIVGHGQVLAVPLPRES